MFPTFNGVFAVDDKKAVLGFVNEKAFHSQQTFSNKLKPIYHNKILFLRGLEYFVFGFYLFFKGLVLSITKDSSPFKISKSVSERLNISFVGVYTFVCSILAILFSFLLFGVIPSYFAVLFVKINISLILRNFILGLLKSIFLFGIILVLKYCPGFNRLFEFNCACNIVCSKESSPLNTKNFLNFVVFGFVLSLFMITFLSVEISAYLKVFYNLFIFATVFSCSYEILELIQKSKNKVLLNIFSWLCSNKPNQTTLLVARSAYWECKMIENTNDDNKKMSVVLAYVQNKLLSEGIDSPREAQWLVAGALNKKVNELLFVSSISSPEEQNIKNVLERRIKGEPLDKIFGMKEFYGLKFAVNNFVLSPRFETELLAEQVILLSKEKKCDILDLCTGSGAIAVAVKLNSSANVFASDISEEAIKIAKQNAKSNNAKINFFKSNMFYDLNIKQKYDIIVSNPPYIPSEDINNLDKEVKDYDPKIALDGGNDGLDFYKIIANESANYLKSDGYLCLEIGIGQDHQVKNLLKKKFKQIKILNDYNHIPRIIIARKKENVR